MMAERHEHAARPSRAWIIWVGGTLAVVLSAFVLSWWLLPRWQPRLVAEYSPWPEPALRAMRYDIDDESYQIVDKRLLSFGPSIGRALLQQFDVGDHQHRLRLVALGTEVAHSDGIAAGTTAPQEVRDRFGNAGFERVRSDLRELVIQALTDGSSYLPNNASYLAAWLRDERLVPPFCAYLAKQKPPVFEDLEPVIRMLGSLGDARAVPVLIPLLPIRHRAHAVVEEALERCLDDTSLTDVMTATAHRHEVIRAWAAHQFPHYRASADLARRLLALLDDQERQVRIAAVQGLAGGGFQPAAARLLALAQKDEDPPVRVAAVEALGDLQFLPAAPYLRTLVVSDQDRLRNEAIVALGDLADAQAFPLLLPLLSHDDKTVALKAHWALTQLPLTDDQRRAVDAVWPIDPAQRGTRSAGDPTLRPSRPLP